MLVILISVYLINIFVLIIIGKYNKKISDLINEPEPRTDLFSNMEVYLAWMFIPVLQQLSIILIIANSVGDFLTKKE